METDSPTVPSNNVIRILSLDGGGAKGFYTLGILYELEAYLGKPLYQHFDLIYGTSTGSIIASLLATGKSVEEIHDLYREHVPAIMRPKRREQKTVALEKAGQMILKDTKFDAAKTGLGIVATKWLLETPMIFKSNPNQSFNRKASFVPGFGCTIAEAVEASASAYPFFDRKIVVTSSGDSVELVDGGYCANNPTLYALADAVGSLGYAHSQCRVLSLGTGNYPEPKKSFLMKLAKRHLLSLQLLQKTLDINKASMEQLRLVLFADVAAVRIDDTFDRPDMATDMFEHDLSKLNLLRQRGRESFGYRESEIKKLFGG